MKKNRLLFGFATLFVAVAILFSCQKDEISVSSDDVLSLKLAEVCENNILPTFPDIPDCDVNCIDTDPYVQGTVSFVRQWAELSEFPGYYKSNKYFTAEAWNDGEKFYVKVTVFGYQYDQEGGKDKVLTGPTCDNYPFNTVIITLDGTPHTFEMDDPSTTDVVETATEYTAEFLLADLFPLGWVKCDEIEYTARLEGQGQPVWLGTDATPANVVYTLFEVCPVGCDTELLGEAISCAEDREAEYTFTYDGEIEYVKIQGGLTNWNGFDAVVTLNDTPVVFDSTENLPNGDIANVGSVGDYTVKQWTPGGSSNRVISVEGPASCTPLVINLQWSVTNLTSPITGDWTAKDADGVLLGEVEGLVCEE